MSELVCLPCPDAKVPTAVSLEVVASASVKLTEVESLTLLVPVVICVHEPAFSLNSSLRVILPAVAPMFIVSNLILKLVLTGTL